MEIAVSVGDRKVLKDSKDILLLDSVGAGVGITLLDSHIPVGGVLHYLLPRAPEANRNQEETQFMFAEWAIPAFIDEMYALGAKKESLKCVVAGSAQLRSQETKVNIGKENSDILEQILGEMGIKTAYSDLGGRAARAMKLDMRSGITYISTLGQGEIQV